MKDSRVLITGADGFIGSHLTERLLAAGASVRAMAWYHPQQQPGWLAEVAASPHLEIMAGDLRDARSCQLACDGTDLIFHLGALIGIPYSYQAPDSYVATNVQGTLNLLEAARTRGTRFVFMSTSEVYGTARQVPIPETHPLQPQSPYSATKIGAEALARSYFHSFGLPVTVARVFNTYGPRQSSRAIIPTIISQLAVGRSSLQLGDLRPTRDLVYVADTCEALLRLGTEPDAIGQVVNVATGREHSMATVVATIQQLMGTQVPVEQDPRRLRPAASEVERLCGDPSLLHQLTGFLPKITLEQGIQATIAWMSDPRHLSHYQPHTYHV